MDEYVKCLLVCQVEEAQRKHDLLVEIIRKDQDHNRRLVRISTHSNDPFTSEETQRDFTLACSRLIVFVIPSWPVTS